MGSQPTPAPATDVPEQGEGSTRQMSRIAFGPGTAKGKHSSPAHAALANSEQGGQSCPHAYSFGGCYPAVIYKSQELWNKRKQLASP